LTGSERGRSLVVDTSAVVAVILGEPGSQELRATDRKRWSVLVRPG